MKIGKIVHTRRSGHGYLFNEDRTGKIKVKVHLIHDFKLTGKIIRCKPESLEFLGDLEKT